MSVSFKTIFKYTPLLVALVILLVGSLFIPWRQVWPYIVKLPIESYALLVGVGVLYYVSRVIRYYYMLHVLGTPRSFRATLLAYFEAQPASLVPGGEAYKAVTLKRHANVHISNSAPIVFLQSFTESIGLVLLALISTLWLHQYAFIIIVVLVLYVFVLVMARTERFSKTHHKLINKLPFINITHYRILSFINKNKMLLSGQSFLILIISGLVPSLIAAYLLFDVANYIGVHLTFAEAVIALSIPAVLQNISFLPGGLGINEQSSVGILLLFGASLPAAVALTLIIRIITLGLGIVIGIFAMFYTKYKK